LRKILLVPAVILFLAGSLLAGMLLGALYYPPQRDRGRTVLVTVDKGDSFEKIIGGLSREGLITHPRLVSLYAELTRLDRGVNAGTYRVVVGERPSTIIRRLVQGDVFKVTVTIPEGFTLRKVAGVLEEAGIDSAAFVSFAGSREAAEKFELQAPGLEGYLFPDTYIIPWGMSVDEAAGVMVSRLRSVFDDSMRARADDLHMNLHEVLTLASIIEAETRLPEERPLVSAVYHNRLRRGMKLEADPTVAYAMGGHRSRLFKKDLAFPSRYNTYLHAGLPPGPICNPGLASIKAALYPDPDSRALYFVARGDGGHIFSMTLREHLAAVSRVRKLKSASRKEEP